MSGLHHSPTVVPPSSIASPHALIAEETAGDDDSDKSRDDGKKRADTDTKSRSKCTQTGHDRLHDRGLPEGQQRNTEARPRQAEGLQRVQEIDEHPAESSEQRSKEAEDRTQNLEAARETEDRKSTRLNSSHVKISYAVSCLKT